MALQPKLAGMTVDEFLVWSKDHPGRHELVDGEVVAMSPQRVRHAETKAAVFAALSRACRGDCRAMPDGMTVRIDRTTAFEPDALVYCGPRLDGDAVEVPSPVIVVEVISPGTKGVDTGRKFAGYFAVPGLHHYLIVNPATRVVTHHRRGESGLVLSRILAEGRLDLDPPGLAVEVSDLLPPA